MTNRDCQWCGRPKPCDCEGEQMTDKTEQMTRKDFISIFGEAPEDVLGQDWENDIIGMKVLKEISYPIKEKELKRTNL